MITCNGYNIVSATDEAGGYLIMDGYNFIEWYPTLEECVGHIETQLKPQHDLPEIFFERYHEQHLEQRSDGKQRVTWNITPAARDALQTLLLRDRRFQGVGYSDFVMRAVRHADLLVSEEKQITDWPKRVELAKEYINRFGGIDGGHHKQWVLDQVLRALMGCPMEVKEALDYKQEPYEYIGQGESEEYKQFLRRRLQEDWDSVPKDERAEWSDEELGWDMGIAP